jgi:hypothetical protein
MIFARVGLAVLHRAWINLDLVWSESRLHTPCAAHGDEAVFVRPRG